MKTWLLDESSKSYIAALPERSRRSLLDAIGELVGKRFPDDHMTVPYETWLWTARKL